MRPNSSPSKARAVALRWALPVVLLALLGLWAGSAAASRLASSYTAEAVLVVPPITPGQSTLGSPADASRLASIYVAALSASQDLRTSVVQSTGVDPDDLRENLVAEINSGTSVLSLTYTGPDEQQALDVLAAATAVITSATPPSPIAVGTLQTIGTAEVTEASGVAPATAALIGCGIGLLLGLVLAWASERSDRRADQANDLRLMLPCPVTDWNRPTATLTEILVERWSSTRRSPEAQIAVVGVGRLKGSALAQVTAALEAAAPAGEPPVHVTAVRGQDEEGDGIVRRSDSTVLLVRRGTRTAVVDAVVDHLVQLGVQPTWALLAPARVRLPAAPASQPADEGTMVHR